MTARKAIVPDDTAAARKRRWVNRFHRYVANPAMRRTAGFIPGHAVLETTGRSSGLARRTPVGGRLIDGSFWLVSNHGRHSHYVCNIDSDPRVRIQLNGRWHTATAHLLDADDAEARLRKLPAHTSVLVRALGTDLLTVRIDVDGIAAGRDRTAT